jgi:heme exporter protein D
MGQGISGEASMIWESWGDFFAMGGYGLYVWGSVVVVLVCMLGEVAFLLQRWNGIRRRLGRWVRTARMEGRQ